MNRSFKKFLLAWSITAATLLLAIALTNLLVDPLRVYRWSFSSRLDPFKSQRDRRVALAEDLRQADPTLLLLGSSRVGEGIPASHPAFAHQRVFKLALFGTNIDECSAAFDYAILHKKQIRQVVFFLDFMMFSERAQGAPDFVHSRFSPSFSPAEYSLECLLGGYATRESLATLENWHARKDPLKTIGQYARELGNRRLIRQTLARSCGADGVYRGFAYGGVTLDRLRHIIHTCRQRHIDLVLVINPVHAVDLECICDQGLWPTYQRWERDLVQINLQETPAGERPCSLWDFSSFTGIEAEPIPPLADCSHPMRWYFENSHFTPALGDLLLCRIYNLPDPTGRASELGVELAPSNLSSHLAQLDSQRAAFGREFPSELAFVRESINLALLSRAGRP